MEQRQEYKPMKQLIAVTNRVSNIVGASEAFLGLAMFIVDPFHARSSGSDLREIAGSTPEEQKNKLDKAENWLERNYKQEKFGRSWLTHVGNLVLGIIGAGIVWHYEGRKNALINGLSGIAGGELLIWTQPTRGIKDYMNIAINIRVLMMAFLRKSIS